MIKIGQSMHPNSVNGDLNKLGKELSRVKDAGAQCCELVLNGLDVIIGARIIETRQEAVIKILREHDLEYTMHMPHDMNLLDTDNQEINMKIFRATIEFARAAGINLLNFHAGTRRIIDKRWPGEQQKVEESVPPDTNTLIKKEISLVKSLATDAPDILFCMENALFGTDPVISVANTTEGLIEFYKQVDLPNFKLTFDIGHSFLFHDGNNAALLEHMERLVPYTGHIHLHDNCGRKAEMRDAFGGRRFTAGAGDIHLPLGWGDIPVKETMSLLKNYNGIVNLEIEQRFSEYYGTCIALVREYLGQH